MFRVLFVVHRYPPYEGGSEYYVRDMAEECRNRGMYVEVFSNYFGTENGITVHGTDFDSHEKRDPFQEKWDLIVVHGADCLNQNVVLNHIQTIQDTLKNPVCYMIIKPSNSYYALQGLKHAKYLAYSTEEDLNHIIKYNGYNRARRIRHGINPVTTIKNVPERNKDHYVSAGGFFPHKAMVPLADAFNAAKKKIHIYGYIDDPSGKPVETEYVKVFLGKTRDEMLEDVASSSGYILNSYEEGFGLVLLEAMINMVPTFSRNTPGAKQLRQYLFSIYKDEAELMLNLGSSELVEDYIKDDVVCKAHKYVMANHTIRQTVDDITTILIEEALTRK